MLREPFILANIEQLADLVRLKLVVREAGKELFTGLLLLRIKLFVPFLVRVS
jgi:hypothetical protein